MAQPEGAELEKVRARRAELRQRYLRPPGERPAIAPASAVVPQSRAVRPPQGGFDFFGTKQSKPAAPAAEEDLADVVGDEAYADHEAARAEDVEQNPAATETEGEPEVIDLTAHDETEQLDLSMLRAQ